MAKKSPAGRSVGGRRRGGVLAGPAGLRREEVGRARPAVAPGLGGAARAWAAAAPGAGGEPRRRRPRAQAASGSRVSWRGGRGRQPEPVAAWQLDAASRGRRGTGVAGREEARGWHRGGVARRSGAGRGGRGVAGRARAGVASRSSGGDLAQRHV